jgi:hypothetical protein
MNQYKEGGDRTGFDARRGETVDYRGIDVAGVRDPVFVGGGSVPPEGVEVPTDEGLSTADIVGKNRPSRTTAPGPSFTSTDPAPTDEPSGPLFSPDEAKDFHAHWDAIQVGFVDEPRQSVVQADNLVASTIKRLAEVFADERQELEGQWTRGESVSTEDLRLALRRYRSFFGRLLSV